MKCYVISGISRVVIQEILRGNFRTLELRNVINVATAMNTDVGDLIFITSAKYVDLERGVTGVIGEVEGKELVSHSAIYARNDYFEEFESTVVRLKIRPRAIGRITRILRKDILNPVEAEAVQVDHFSAR